MTVSSAVRALLEVAIADALGPVAVVYDNTFESPPPLPYAKATISYDSQSEDALGGDSAGFVTGVFQVNIHTEKMTGSGQAEALGEQVLDAMRGLVTTPAVGPGWRVVARSLEGPTTLAPDDRAAHVVVVGGAFSASLL